MFIYEPQWKFLFLGRLISVKVDSIFLSKRILRSLGLIYEYFSLIKKSVPPWVLFVSSKQKAKPGKDAINWSVQSDFVSLKRIIGKCNFIKLNKLERPSMYLFKDAMFTWRIPKCFFFVLRAFISLIIKYFDFELIRM